MVNKIETGIRYIVTKRSKDHTFEVGDHIIFNLDGSISCLEEQGWVDEEGVEEATKGMECCIDVVHIRNKIDQHLKQLEKLQNLLEYTPSEPLEF